MDEKGNVTQEMVEARHRHAIGDDHPEKQDFYVGWWLAEDGKPIPSEDAERVVLRQGWEAYQNRST